MAYSIQVTSSAREFPATNWVNDSSAPARPISQSSYLPTISINAGTKTTSIHTFLYASDYTSYSGAAFEIELGLGWETNGNATITLYNGPVGTYNVTTSGSGNRRTYTVNTYTATRWEINIPIKRKSITISYNANGGTGTMSSQTATAGIETTLTANSFTKDNYDFSGWNTAADGTGTSYANQETVTLYDNVTLYAQWEHTQYIISFDANGGSGTMAPQQVNSGEPTTLNRNTFILGSFRFIGWNTEADGSGTPYADQAQITITSDITLYAQWAFSTITISFIPAGGSDPSPNYKTVSYGAQYGALPTTTREGYTFTGWFDSFGNMIIASSIVRQTGPHQLFAHWSTNPIIVTFNGNGGTPSEASRSISYGDPYGPLPTATKSAQFLLGWFTAASGGDRVSENDYPTSNITLYAQWDNATVVWWRVSS